MGSVCTEIQWHTRICVTPSLRILSLVNTNAWLKWIWNPSIKNLNAGEDLVDWLTDWLRCSKLININVVVIGVLMWMNYALANLNWPTVKVNKIQGVFSLYPLMTKKGMSILLCASGAKTTHLLRIRPNLNDPTVYFVKFQIFWEGQKICPIFH